MPLQIIRQDITKMRVDAIVNTTNEEMIGYSGVDLAIHTIAGAELDAECAKLAPLGLGQAKLSGAYSLPCKYVIHTSGPVWRGGLVGESIILRSCYIESLKLAVKSGCRSVAFPLISSGVYAEALTISATLASISSSVTVTPVASTSARITSAVLTFLAAASLACSRTFSSVSCIISRYCS